MGLTKMGDGETLVCERCGDPRATVAGWAMPCATCHVARSREAEERAAEERRQAIEGRRRQRLARWSDSVPARFAWTLQPSAAELERIPLAVRARCDLLTSPETRAFVGRAGAGKTSAAALLVSRWARDGAACLWLSAREVDEHARESRLGAAPPRELVRARSVEVLMLDDIGTEGTIGTEEVVRLVHARHDDDLATVATTGLSRTQLAARYGEGIARRLLEAGAIVVTNGPVAATAGGLL